MTSTQLSSDDDGNNKSTRTNKTNKAYDSERAKAKYQLFKKVRADYEERLAERDAAIRKREQEILQLQARLIELLQSIATPSHS